MKNDGSKPVSPDAVRKAEREARLAEQLRANLKRRKAAARAEVALQKATTGRSISEKVDEPDRDAGND